MSGKRKAGSEDASMLSLDQMRELIEASSLRGAEVATSKLEAKLVEVATVANQALVKATEVEQKQLLVEKDVGALTPTVAKLERGMESTRSGKSGSVSSSSGGGGGGGRSSSNDWLPSFFKIHVSTFNSGQEGYLETNAKKLKHWPMMHSREMVLKVQWFG